MDDEAFEALLGSLVIGCAEKPQRVLELKMRLWDRIGSSHVDLTQRDITVDHNGTRLVGWIDKCSYEHDFGRGATRITLSIDAREMKGS